MDAIIGLDLGTTGIRAIAFSDSGTLISSAYQPIPLECPQPGWVEQDPITIRDGAFQVLKQVIQSLSGFNIVGLGITNQRETTICWDRRTGQPVANAIVWQCRRTAELCHQRDGYRDLIFQKTGLRLDPYFSATKIEWILQNIPVASELARQNQLAFGTVDSWIIWHLTADQRHVTDASNASRTMLVNIDTGQYDADLLRMFNIPESILPRILNSQDHFGETNPNITGISIPIRAVIGDQQAALFAHGQTQVGTIKNTYGTGLFIMANTGQDRFAHSELVSTIAWQLNGVITYATEGSVFTGGAIIQWLRDELGLITSAEETEEIAHSIPDTAGVVIVPALTGLGAPYWQADIRGSIVGITRGCNRRHIIRAALESLAHQSADVIERFISSAHVPVDSLRVDGGASNNSFLMQFQADLLNLPVIKTKNSETTALGAAMLAALDAGIWTHAFLKTLNPIEKTYTPTLSKERRAKARNAWSHAIRQTLTK